MKLFKRTKIKHCKVRNCKEPVTHVGVGEDPSVCLCDTHYSQYIVTIKARKVY